MTLENKSRQKLQRGRAGESSKEQTAMERAMVAERDGGDQRGLPVCLAKEVACLAQPQKELLAWLNLKKSCLLGSTSKRVACLAQPQRSCLLGSTSKKLLAWLNLKEVACLAQPQKSCWNSDKVHTTYLPPRCVD